MIKEHGLLEVISTAATGCFISGGTAYYVGKFIGIALGADAAAYAVVGGVYGLTTFFGFAATRICGVKSAKSAAVFGQILGIAVATLSAFYGNPILLGNVMWYAIAACFCVGVLGMVGRMARVPKQSL